MKKFLKKIRDAWSLLSAHDYFFIKANKGLSELKFNEAVVFARHVYALSLTFVERDTTEEERESKLARYCTILNILNGYDFIFQCVHDDADPYVTYDCSEENFELLKQQEID